jgi:Retrotransposon gag protein
MKKAYSSDDISTYTMEPTAPIYRNAGNDNLDNTSFLFKPTEVRKDMDKKMSNEQNTITPDYISATPNKVIFEASKPFGHAVYPPVYNGKNNVSIEDWIWQYELSVRANRWSEKDKVTRFYFLLDGNPSTYCGQLLQEKGNISWDELKTLMIRQFGRSMNKLIAWEYLNQRRQKDNEQVEDYMYAMVELMNQAERDMKLENKITHIVKGIREGLRKEVLTLITNQMPNSLEDFMQLVKRIDAIDGFENGSHKYRKTVKFSNPEKSYYNNNSELKQIRQDFYNLQKEIRR